MFDRGWNIMCFLMLAACLVFPNYLLAQGNAARQIVKGKVKDETKNFFLTSATASLFKADSTLVSFQITDTYGSFSFDNLHVGQNYYLQISNVGYAMQTKHFKIDKPGGSIDLGTIALNESEIGLKEVTINMSPVTMNGDTLEFNPRGFKMDSNAVAEDFLRKIPNITIWNDGQITVNGREVKTLMVNGKPFFGGDFKVATQNLPSKIIDKVQVYRKEENKLNPLDSIMEMNIKLKQGINNGYFGKISIGGGTRERFDLESSINYYTKRMQISIAGAGNNINKIAEDVATLIAQGTYKNRNSYLDYQTDLGLPGLNKIYVGGANFSYDFIEKPEFNNKSRITANQFYRYREVAETIDNVIVTTLGDNSRNLEKGLNVNDKMLRSNMFNVNYNLVKPEQSISISSNFDHRNERSSESAIVNITDALGETLSNSNSVYNDVKSVQKYRINASYDYQPQYFKNRKKPPFSFSYSGKFDDGRSDSDLQRLFVSNSDQSSNSRFNRKYHYASEGIQHKLDFTLRNFEQVVLGYGKYLLNVDLIGRYGWTANELRSQVSDFDNISYTINKYLSDNSLVREQNLLYGAKLGKVFSNKLTERYEKNILISLGLLFTDVNLNNKSDFSFRKIQRSYSEFMPEASLIVANNIFGKYKTTFNSEFRTELNLPQIDQLAPLVDSAQVYLIRQGNLGLQQEKIYTANTSFEYVDLKTNNAFLVKLGAGASFSDNKIVDSILIMPDSRQELYPINMSSYLKMGAYFELRKSIKFVASDLKIFLGGNIDRISSPTFINQKYLKNNSENIMVTSTIGYGIADLLNIEFRERLLFSSLKQDLLSSRYNGTTFSHTLNVNYLINKNISLNSNVTYNSNRSTWASPINFTIWNAYLTYRLLKNGNGEVKLSAVDLLGQNRNVVNKFYNANFATIYRNNLQRYIMLSFSYYPRSFKKE